MLVQSDYNAGLASIRSSRRTTHSLLDSPTLARVERAMLRHEEGSDRSLLQLRSQTQSLLSNNYKKETNDCIKRGLMFQQRDKLFSRWKERYFILTPDYLHCFRRASGADRISEMGQFLFKIKLIDVERVEWENKKTYSTVALVLIRDGKILLRASDGLEDWFELLEECTMSSKERRRALRYTHDSSIKNHLLQMDDWWNQKPQNDFRGEEALNVRSDVIIRQRDRTPENEDWENFTLDNRLSLLTDIDINSYDDSTLGIPSVKSYRMNQDVLCIQPPSLRPINSFRSARDKSNCSTKNKSDFQSQHNHIIKFRERSYSDIQRVDHRPWKGMDLTSYKFE